MCTSVDDSKISSSSGNNKKFGNSTKCNLIRTIQRVKKPTFSTYNSRQIFIQSRPLFTKASIPKPFDLGRHIQIKTDTPGYIIDSILS